MSFPASLTLVTVACRFDLPPSGGAYGSVTFNRPYPLVGPTDDSIVPPDATVGYLAADGTCTVVLPATNDPQWTPTGWAYSVSCQVGGARFSGTLQLDYQTTTVELADLLQVDGTAASGTTYIPLSYRGAVNGVASLGADGIVPTGQLPPGSGGTVVSSVNTRTGDVTLTSSDVGLGNVTNTSDANKPVSTAQQTALDLKAALVSPTFTGTPAAPTAAGGTNTTQLATTAFVGTAVAALTPLLVLAAADPVPGGTAAGTVIVRTAT